MIPASLEMLFNFRFSSEVTAAQLMQRSEAVLAAHGVDYDIEWCTSGLPFITESGRLLTVVKQSIKDITGSETKLSTAGGTSDGRFIAPTGAEVVELGPVNETIHKVNECVKVSDLNTLADTYVNILQNLFSE